MRILVTIAITLATACSGRPPAPPPAPAEPTITQTIFEPVYRASKAIEGATAAGVSYGQFSELMQDFATELTIAKDKSMSELDRALHAIYVEAFADYQFSVALWQASNENGVKYYEGIAVEVAGMARPDVPLLSKYGIVPTPHVMKWTGAKYKSIPRNSIQVVWAHASKKIGAATEIYYGRAQPPTAATPVAGSGW